MEVITEYGNYWDLKEHSWSGALDTLADIENAGKEEELMQHLEDMFADRTPTDTDINDYLWHDREYVYEALGLNSNGEIPTEVDKARDEDTVWVVTVTELKKSGLFEDSLIDFVIDMVKTDEDEDGNPIFDDEETYMLSFGELDRESSKEITEDQVEWLNANG